MAYRLMDLKAPLPWQQDDGTASVLEFGSREELGELLLHSLGPAAPQVGICHHLPAPGARAGGEKALGAPLHLAVTVLGHHHGVGEAVQKVALDERAVAVPEPVPHPLKVEEHHLRCTKSALSLSSKPPRKRELLLKGHIEGVLHNGRGVGPGDSGQNAHVQGNAHQQRSCFRVGKSLFKGFRHI
ncbi:MAG: hypothetical protein MZV64_36980 [Ignavibacteriales bacterium]|nr:hypothetical protein [Ignavibacteriales bacterium]